MGLRSLARALVLRKKYHMINKSLKADRELVNVDFPFSKGWAFQAESFGGLENVFQHSETKISKRQFEKYYSKNAQSYWIRTGSKNFPILDFFVEKVLPFQTRPFFLISSDGVLTVPNDANPLSVTKVLEHPKLICWYSQNADLTKIKTNKLKQIPIGLDLHTPRSDGVGYVLFNKFKAIAETATTFDERSNSIFVDIHLNQSHSLRRQVSDLLIGNPNYSFISDRISQLDLWRLYGKHKYVLSIIGKGYDCHRTWEALGLGCRIVTISSPLDDLLKKYPVYIADCKEDLADPNLSRQLEIFFARRTQVEIKFSDFMKPHD